VEPRDEYRERDTGDGGTHLPVRGLEVRGQRYTQTAELGHSNCGLKNCGLSDCDRSRLQNTGVGEHNIHAAGYAAAKWKDGRRQRLQKAVEEDMLQYTVEITRYKRED